MTKGKKAQKHPKSNVPKNVEPDVEKSKEDVIRQTSEVATTSVENVSKSEALNSTVTDACVSKQACAKIIDDTKNQIVSKNEKEEEKSAVDNGSKEEKLDHVKKQNEEKVTINTEQSVENLVLVSDTVLQNEDQKTSKLHNNTQAAVHKPSTEKENKVGIKSETDKSNDIQPQTEQKTKLLVVEAVVEDKLQQNTNEDKVESPKIGENDEKKDFVHQEENLNENKKVKKTVPKNETNSDKNTTDTNKKDQKSKDLKATKKTDAEHKKEVGFNNEHKKKQDPANKDTVKAAHVDSGNQSGGTRISGIEIKEHIHGNAVSTLFNESQSSDEKFKIICEKYTELYADFSVLQLLAKRQEKEMELKKNENEIFECEIAKQNLSREKLEHLCRELQKQNKEIREENLKIVHEEEEKRKSVAQKFQCTLNEISSQVQESNSKTSKLRDDNLDITVKFRDLLIQFEEKEQELFDYKARCAEMLQTEKALRNQISMYTEKYDEFQQTLSRSNEIFAGFKSEMESMSSKINNLESETATWKTRWEHSHQAYLEVFNQKTNAETQLLTTSRQMATLLKLCRTLQSERSNLLAKLNGNDPGIKPTTEDEANQETMEETLRQLVKNVSETFKTPPPPSVSANNSASTVTDEPTVAEKSNSTSESPNNKPANKKGKNKK